jgi:flagellin-like hook-associated protein FlgL
MAVNDITLAGGMRAALAQLQLTAQLQGRTTQRLATGLKVNSPIDDAGAFFAAQNHRSRANDLDARKSGMDEAIQTIKAADGGIKAITDLIQQAKGLAASARSATVADRATLATQYNGLLTQIDNLANDASYKGTDLLGAGSSLTVALNEGGSSTLTVTGFDASSTGLSIAGAANAWAADADITAASTDLDTALTTLRANGQSLSSNNGVIAARLQFTADMITTLSQGADSLTAADSNEEGANMVALQTRQQLGIVALSLTNQANQSILRLFQ